MALTLTKLSWGTSATSSATLTVNGGYPNAITASVGDMLVVFVSAENSGTNGAASLSSVSDSAGNTYTNRGITNYDPGAARAGITVGIFTTLVTTAITAGSVTVNFSPNTQYKSAVVYLLEPTSGYTPTVRVVGSGITGNEGSTAISITTSSLSTDDVVFGVAAWEEASPTFTVTEDADTTRGTWNSVDGSSSGFGVDWFGVFGSPYQAILLPQYKTVTSAGTQTWDASIASANPDYAANYIAFYEELNAPTYSLVGEGGTYSISEDTTTSLAYGRIFAADTTAYSISGTAATLTYAKVVFNEGASYTINGQDATLTKGGAPTGYTFSLNEGSYFVSGTDATFDLTYVLVANTANYGINGTAVDLYKGQTVAANAGSYSVSGTTATFASSKVVAADTSSYSISGTAVSFLYGRDVIAASGSYTVTGQNATFQAGQRRHFVDPGSYSIEGTSAGLFPAPSSGTVLIGIDPNITFWVNPDGLVVSYPRGYSFLKWIRRSYNTNGNGNIFVTQGGTSGVFDERGHLRVNLVDGSSYVGMYSSTGAINAILIDADDEEPDQLFHSSGALRIIAADSNTLGAISPINGALQVANL